MSRHASSLVALVLLTTLAAPDSLAARRRAVRPSRPRLSTGQCHTFGFVRAGLEASYRTTTPGQPDVTYTITYVTDTATQSKVTQKVTTPQGTADAETNILFESVAGNLRAAKHIDLKASMTVLGFPISIDTDIDFVPSLTWGPAEGWCQGATWIVPVTNVTTKTTTTPPGTSQTSLSSTLAGTGQVLSVNEPISVTAGTFQTVKYRGVGISSACPTGSTNCASGAVPTISWIWRDQPIVVRQDTLDAGGNVTSTTVLTSVQ